MLRVILVPELDKECAVQEGMKIVEEMLKKRALALLKCVHVSTISVFREINHR